MDAVKVFNQDLSSLYESKPPISKAKMTSITKGAIKAIKFYKHVVQSVEKFIQKCRPEYKIPGLYVIDSIVRQSRHQFGADKDVFAPRFSKNIRLTFFHLYKCAEEEKSKVIRVLNLWQKNEVFASEVIQPLFDLANPRSELTRQMEEHVKSGGKGPAPGGKAALGTPAKGSAAPGGIQVSSDLMGNSHNSADQHMTQQLQTILQLLKNHAQPNQVKFNKKLLDFDYSDDEEAGGEQQEQQLSPAMLEALQGILENKPVLNKLKSMGAITELQITQLQQLLPTAAAQKHQPLLPTSAAGGAATASMSTAHHHMGFQQQQFELAQQQQQPASGGGALLNLGSMGWGAPNPPAAAGTQQPQMQSPNIQVVNMVSGKSPMEEGEHAETDEDIQIVEDRSMSGWRSGGRDRGSRRRSRSRDRDRKGGRGRSRSRSRDRSGRRRRSRSREGRRGDFDRNYEEDRHKRREREKKGLPPIRTGYLSVCSTTLWVGHLSKLVAEEELSDLFGEVGVVNTINLIPPRGCAFVCMNRRMDAYKALKSLHKHKLQGKPITLAWAPGKGMKDKQWKDYWDVELGVSYIPINKLDPQVNMAILEEGSTFDDDTMPDWMKTMRGVAPDSAMVGAMPATAPAGGPQFIPVPEGMPPPANSIAVPPPAMAPPPTQQPPPQIPPAAANLTAPPPGLPPPFGLPPGAHAPGPGGLLPPGPPPNLLAGQPGILPPPGAAGLIGAAPPNLLLGAPLGQPGGPAALMAGPPPGLPGFDASQPPPGLRLPFPPPVAGAPAGALPPRMPPPLLTDQLFKPPDAGPSNNGLDASLKQEQLHGSPTKRRDRGERKSSRWGSEKSEEPSAAKPQPGGGPGRGGTGDNSLAARLRSLAGMGDGDGEGGVQNDPGVPPAVPPFRRGIFEGPAAGFVPPGGPGVNPDGGPFAGAGLGRPDTLGEQQRGPLFDTPPEQFRGPGGPGGPPPFMDGPPGAGGPLFLERPPFGVEGGPPPPPFGEGGPLFNPHDGPPPMGLFAAMGGRGGGRGGWRGRGGGPPHLMDGGVRPPLFGDGGGPPRGEMDRPEPRENFDNPTDGPSGRTLGRGGRKPLIPGLFGERRDGEPSNSAPPPKRTRWGDEGDQDKDEGIKANNEEEIKADEPSREDPENAPASTTSPTSMDHSEGRIEGEEGRPAAAVAEDSTEPAGSPVTTAANIVGSLYEDDDDEDDDAEEDKQEVGTGGSPPDTNMESTQHQGAEEGQGGAPLSPQGSNDPGEQEDPQDGHGNHQHFDPEAIVAAAVPEEDHRPDPDDHARTAEQPTSSPVAEELAQAQVEEQHRQQQQSQFSIASMVGKEAENDEEERVNSPPTTEQPSGSPPAEAQPFEQVEQPASTLEQDNDDHSGGEGGQQPLEEPAEEADA